MMNNENQSCGVSERLFNELRIWEKEIVKDGKAKEIEIVGLIFIADGKTYTTAVSKNFGEGIAFKAVRVKDEDR